MTNREVIERKEHATAHATLFAHPFLYSRSHIMHRAPMPTPLPEEDPAQEDDMSPLPGTPSEDEPVPDHNPTV
jgi:hypothetical protein